MWEISWLAEDLFASQEWLCSMELVIMVMLGLYREIGYIPGSSRGSKPSLRSTPPPVQLVPYSSLGGKGAGVWGWLVFFKCRNWWCTDLYLHSRLYVHRLVLNQSLKQYAFTLRSHMYQSRRILCKTRELTNLQHPTITPSLSGPQHPARNKH
jgi:hypothetical protein